MPLCCFSKAQCRVFASCWVSGPAWPDGWPRNGLECTYILCLRSHCPNCRSAHMVQLISHQFTASCAGFCSGAMLCSVDSRSSHQDRSSRLISHIWPHGCHCSQMDPSDIALLTSRTAWPIASFGVMIPPLRFVMDRVCRPSWPVQPTSE